MGATTIISGQWEGYFEYTGTHPLRGARIKFRLSLIETTGGQFVGECLELEGEGHNPDVARISGFVEGSFINFTKEYPVHFSAGANGERVAREHIIKPLINYIGNFDWFLNAYDGIWEIYV